MVTGPVLSDLVSEERGRVGGGVDGWWDGRLQLHLNGHSGAAEAGLEPQTLRTEGEASGGGRAELTSAAAAATRPPLPPRAALTPAPTSPPPPPVRHLTPPSCPLISASADTARACASSSSSLSFPSPRHRCSLCVAVGVLSVLCASHRHSLILLLHLLLRPAVLCCDGSAWQLQLLGSQRLGVVLL